MMFWNRRKSRHKNFLYLRIIEVRKDIVTLGLKISLKDKSNQQMELLYLVDKLSVKGKLLRKYSRRDKLINF